MEVPHPIRQPRIGGHGSTNTHDSGIPLRPRTHSASSAGLRHSRTSSLSNNENEKQLKEYCKCVEEDHAQLRSAFLDQKTELEALDALNKENKLKEDMIYAVDRRTKLACDFLGELNTLLEEGRALATRSDKNSQSSSETKRKKMLVSLNYRTTEINKLIDSVRDGFQKKMKELQTAKESERVQLQAAQAAEKEVSQLKEKVKALTRKQTFSDDTLIITSQGNADALTRDMQKLRKQYEDAQREIKAISAELNTSQQTAKSAAAKVNVQQDEIRELRRQLDAQDNIMREMEKKMTNGNSNAASGNPSSSSGAATTIVTHHYRVLNGRGYAQAWKEQGKNFMELFTKATVNALRLSRDAITALDAQSGGEGVSLDFDVRHSSAVSLEHIDAILLKYPYEELNELKKRGEASLIKLQNDVSDELRRELKETKNSLFTAQSEASALSERVRELESSLDRRDAIETEVDSALQETEQTIQELYEALEAQKASTQKASQSAEENEKEAAQLRSSVADLKEQLKECEETLAKKQTLLNSAETKLRAVEKEVTKLRSDAKTREGAEKAEVEHLNATIAELREGLDLVTKRESMLKEAMREEKAKRDKLIVENAKQMESMSKDQEKGLQTALEKIKDLEERAESVNTILDNALPSSERRSGSFNSAEEKAKRLIDILRTTDTVLRKEKERLQTLEGSYKKLQQEHANLKKSSTLQSTSKGKEMKESQEAFSHLQTEYSEFRADAETKIENLKAQLQEAHSALNAAQAKEKQSASLLAAKQKSKQEPSEWELELQKTLEVREKEMENMKAELERAKRVEKRLVASKIELEAQLKKNGGGSSSARLAPANPEDQEESAAGGVASARLSENSLREELKTARRNNDCLSTQIKEMETDMNGLGKIQSELQAALEEAQKELRSNKNDMETLVKQVIRMEENERQLRERLDEKESQNVNVKKSENEDEAMKTPVAARSRLPLCPSPLVNQMSDTKSSNTNNNNNSFGSVSKLTSTPPNKRIVMKRTNSAKTFSRTNSAPSPGGDGSPMESFNDRNASEAFRVVKNSTSNNNTTTNNNKTPRRDLLPSGSQAAAKNSYAGGTSPVGASKNSSYTNNNSFSGNHSNARESASAAANSRRRVLSPNASRKAAGGSGNSTSAAGGGGAFQRSHSSTAGGGASFVRTASGYQRLESATISK